LKYDYGDCIEAFQGNPLFIDIIKFKVWSSVMPIWFLPSLSTSLS
jgi:hypothetical protein